MCATAQPEVPTGPASFSQFTRPVTSITAPDPNTVIMKTAAPHPLLPRDLTSLQIISKNQVAARTDDFNSGKAMNGTGPYKLVEYKPGERVVFARNDAWWGGKTAWPRVQYRMISNNAARVAALLSGDVHVIENVPTADAERLKSNAQLALASATSNRVIYLHMDSWRDKNSPFVRTTAGQPMEDNPLPHPPVR